MNEINRRAGRPSKNRTRNLFEANKTLVKSMQILERLGQSKQGLTLSELSQQLGIAPATIHRLLYTFEELEYVYQNKELGLWSIGIKAFIVGNAFINRRDVVILAKPYMTELMELSGETVNLSIADKGEIVYVGQVESNEMMRMTAKLGGRAPIHASGAGKALLSTYTQHQINAILQKRGLKRITPNTIDSTDKLIEELDLTRARGYAVDDEEHTIGLRCVAAPVFDETGNAYMGISISGPKVRISDKQLNYFGSMITKTAGHITRATGGVVPDGD